MNIYEVLKDSFRYRKQWTILQGPKCLDGDTGYREGQFLLTEKQEGFGGEKQRVSKGGGKWYVPGFCVEVIWSHVPVCCVEVIWSSVPGCSVVVSWSDVPGFCMEVSWSDVPGCCVEVSGSSVPGVLF